VPLSEPRNPVPSSSSPLALSPNGIKTWQTCPRKYYWRYCYGIQGVQAPSDDIKFGTAFHAALEHNHAKPMATWSVREAVAGLDADLGALVSGAVAAYGVRWAEEPLQYTHKEYELRTPLRNPRVRLLAILDGIATTSRGELVVVDHKTSGKDVSAGSWFGEKLQVNTQASAYIWAARSNGFPVSHGVWDAIKRPSMRRRIEDVPPEHYLKSGKWGNAGDLKPGTGVPAESPGEYAVRVKGTMLSAPGDYFARHEVIRLDDELADAIEGINEVADQIIYAWNANAFPQNDAACGFAPQYKCEYFDLCAGAASPEDTTLYQIRSKRKEIEL
jgi:CRISPR/Cas system-associated exonuclease Cas4 (RecB family)